MTHLVKWQPAAYFFRNFLFIFRKTRFSRLPHALLRFLVHISPHAEKQARHRLVKTGLTPGLLVTCQLSIICTVKLLLVTAVKRLLTRWFKARPTCCCYSVRVGVVERLCYSVSMHCQGSPAPPTSSRSRDATVQKLPQLISITGRVITGVFSAGS